MTRSGDEYVRGLRDGRTVLLNGERVADVTTHPAFAAGIRTVAQLYDLAHDPRRDDLPLAARWPADQQVLAGAAHPRGLGGAAVRDQILG